MQKLFIGTVVLLAMAFGASTANAQTTVNFNTTSATGITFTSAGTGGLVTANVNATGSATSSLPTGDYTYTLVGGPATLTPIGAGDYTASNTPITLTLAGTDVTGGLTGTVGLIDLSQSGLGGIVNYNFLANVIVTAASGTLGEFASAGSGTLNLALKLSSMTPIDDLTSASASISSGSLTPSPEPSTMLLFGSGLLLLGGFLRRQPHHA